MRLSRVLLAGAAVAAAGVATSAFTAGNTVEESVAGYGDARVSGATTSNIDYALDTTDKSEATAINFEIVEDLDSAVYEGVTAYLQLQQADGTAVGSAITCSIAAYSVDHTPISCPLPADTKLATFDRIGLTVAE